jgi:hypothetical protein
VNNEKLEVEKRDLSEMRVVRLMEVDESFNEVQGVWGDKGGDSRGCKLSGKILKTLPPR